MYFTEDNLAWFWSALCLGALLGVIVYGLRRRADRAAEWARIKRHVLASVVLLSIIVSVGAVLIWIVSGGRLLGAWTLWCAAGVGVVAIIGNDLEIRRSRRSRQ